VPDVRGWKPRYADLVASRFASRAAVALKLVSQPSAWAGRRSRSASPAGILVLQQLLLGDTLLLTPLLSKLRRDHPRARIAMAVARPLLPLYASRPYGVEPLYYDARDPASLAGLANGGGWDWTLLPADNRFAYLARALGSRWIIGFEGDVPAYKNWPVDELRPFPAFPTTYADMAAGLVDGPPPEPYAVGQWPAPNLPPPSLPVDGDFAVLHVGASTPLKAWPVPRWRALAEKLAALGYRIVWSGGPGEGALVDAVDPDRRYPSLAGKVGLGELWHVLRRASLLVCPDTGIAHLGRIVGVPTVTLFGPGAVEMYGAGEFWRDSAYRAVTFPDFPCRDQPMLFRRSLPWVRRCERDTTQCAGPRCMDAIDFDRVWDAVAELLPTR